MKKQTIFQFILNYLKIYKVSFFFITFLYGFLALERVYLPYLVGNIIDIIKSIDDKIGWWVAVKPTFFIIIFVMFGMDILFRLQEVIFEYVMPRFKARIRADVFNYTMNHSSRFFSENHAGDVGAKINTLTQNIFLIVTKVANVFSPIILTIAVAIISIYKINHDVGFVYLIWVGIHVLITLLTIKWMARVWEVSAEKNSIVQGKIVDSINNILNIRLFGRQKNEVNYYKKYEDDNIEASFKAGLVGIYIRSMISIISLIGSGATIYFILQAWSIDIITIGNVSTLFAIIVNGILLLWWMSYEMIYFYNDIGGAKNAFNLLTKDHEIYEIENATEIKIDNTNSCIEFKNVVFSYNNKKFFNDVNVKILAGQKVGLVGFSGAGKTTFANLIMREFDIQSGEILINNYNIKNVTLDSLRKSISYITQDIGMFHRTVIENIRFGAEKVTDDDIIRVSKDACCDDFIVKLEKSYNTIVGEKGAKLSGGQKQRISIARAMLKDSPIIILDEATSALDSVTEGKIKEAISRLSVGKTTIIIAHRLSTLREVDRILVFEEGRIIEDGSHSELISRENGYYKRLWESQNDYYEKDEDCNDV